MAILYHEGIVLRRQKDFALKCKLLPKYKMADACSIILTVVCVAYLVILAWYFLFRQRNRCDTCDKVLAPRRHIERHIEIVLPRPDFIASLGEGETQM